MTGINEYRSLGGGGSAIGRTLVGVRRASRFSKSLRLAGLLFVTEPPAAPPVSTKAINEPQSSFFFVATEPDATDEPEDEDSARCVKLLGKPISIPLVQLELLFREEPATLLAEAPVLTAERKHDNCYYIIYCKYFFQLIKVKNIYLKERVEVVHKASKWVNLLYRWSSMLQLF